MASASRAQPLDDSTSAEGPAEGSQGKRVLRAPLDDSTSAEGAA